jgi:hypothetical protein
MHLMEWLVWIPILMAFWVLYDAPQHGLSRWWALGSLLLCVFFFPLYLMGRGATIRQTERQREDQWRQEQREQWAREAERH